MSVAYFQAVETIARAPGERCFDLVLAVRRYAEWWPRVDCQPLGPEALLHVGSRVRFATDGASWVTEVVRLEPHRRIDLRYAEGDLRGPCAWEFDSHQGATRVRYVHRGVQVQSARCSERLALPGAVLSADALTGLRRVLEAPAADVSGGDLFEALATQRAVRRFRPDPISDAVLREILAAAVRAPSARNAQPWAFIAVRDAAIKAAIGRHYLAAWRQAQAFTAQVDADADLKAQPGYDRMMRGVNDLAEHLEQAPVLVLCCLDLAQLGPMADPNGEIRAPQSAYASIFPAAQNLMLAARGLGVGSTLTTLHQFSETALRELVHLPKHMHIAALIPLGYPTRPFRVTTRKPLEAVAFLDRWGRPFPPR